MIGHDELLIIFGLFLALVVGVGLFNFIGIKGELGALLVGLLISNHSKSCQILSEFIEKCKASEGLDGYISEKFYDLQINSNYKK